MPVFVDYPVSAFLVVAAVGPALEFVIEHVVQFTEHLFAAHGGVVVTPPADNRVEVVYQADLVAVSVLVYHCRQRQVVSSYSFFARFDDGLEAEWFALPGVPRP